MHFAGNFQKSFTKTKKLTKKLKKISCFLAVNNIKLDRVSNVFCIFFLFFWRKDFTKFFLIATQITAPSRLNFAFIHLFFM